MELELVPKEAFGSDQKPHTANDAPAYKGNERRRRERRILVDRRDLVRFELKADRRNGHERRTDLRIWDGRHSF